MVGSQNTSLIAVFKVTEWSSLYTQIKLITSPLLYPTFFYTLPSGNVILLGVQSGTEQFFCDTYRFEKCSLSPSKFYAIDQCCLIFDITIIAVEKQLVVCLADGKDQLEPAIQTS